MEFEVFVPLHLNVVELLKEGLAFVAYEFHSELESYLELWVNLMELEGQEVKTGIVRPWVSEFIYLLFFLLFSLQVAYHILMGL